jgi:hypothetical protein
MHKAMVMTALCRIPDYAGQDGNSDEDCARYPA